MTLKQVLKTGGGGGAFGASVMAVHDVMLSGGGATDDPLRFAQEGSLQLLLYAVLGALLGLVASLVVPAIARLLTRQRSYEAYVPGGLLLILAGLVMLAGTPGPQADEAPALAFALLACILLAVGAALLATRLAPNGSPSWVPLGVGILTGAGVLFAGLRAMLASILATSISACLGTAGAALVAGLIVYWIVAQVQRIAASRWSKPRAAWGLAALLAAPICVLAVWPLLPSGSAGSPGSVSDLQASGDTSRPNVILISVDTLRADYVGYAGGPARTPNLDALAEKSYVFENAYSVAPWTRPSFAAFFSSRYPSEMGVARARGYMGFGASTIPYQWLARPCLLAESLQSGEYHTCAVVTNANLTVAANADQGFAEFYHCSWSDTRSRRATALVGGMLAAVWPFAPEMHPSLGPERAESVSSAAIRSVSSSGDRPLLFWVHYMDPHQPYDPPSLPEDRKIVPDRADTASGRSNGSAMEREAFIAAYTAEIEYWDGWFRGVLSALDQHNLLDQSVIIFWSDHGEEFWEHGGWEHGHTLFDEVLKVPMLIHLPGQNVSRRVSDYVSLLDVAPTVLDLCDVPLPDGMQGRSLVPLMKPGEGAIPGMSVFLEGCAAGGIRKGLIRDHHKLIYDVHQDYFRLYDLEQDPEERHNIYGMPQAPGNIAEMERDLLQWTERSLAMMDAHVTEGGAGEVPPGLRQQLKDMGYIQ